MESNVLLPSEVALWVVECFGKSKQSRQYKLTEMGN